MSLEPAGESAAIFVPHGDELDAHASSLDIPLNQSASTDLSRGQIKQQLKRGSRGWRVECSEVDTAEAKITDEGD
ncbi:MAG TPA: hypothetical protein VKD70_04960 [Candidatus Acidoferrum sp.]|nr:hypothetical protein [Candidatus Acidoferrum sp.]